MTVINDNYDQFIYYNDKLHLDMAHFHFEFGALKEEMLGKLIADKEELQKQISSNMDKI